MEMKKPVLSILLNFINNSVKHDTNYEIAKGMLKNYDLIPNKTIHQMADICYVSSASVSRFVKVIGFKDYTAYKNAIKNKIDINVDYSDEVSYANKGDLIPVLKTYTDNIIDNINFAFNNVDLNQFERLTKLIHESKEVVFLGLEFATLIGTHFQIKMAELNKHIQIGITFEEQLELIKTLSEESLVIIASLEGGYFYRNDKIIRTIQEKNANIVTLTMNKNLKPLQVADEIILISKTNSNTEGRISLLYIIELIIMVYYVHYKDD